MERWQKVRARARDAPPDDLAVALAVEGRHGPVIHATNRPARLAGIALGARVVDVKAVCPDLHVGHADPAGDRRALERLMLWARRWCPWSVVDASGGAADGLILDTTGSAHLLGGEAAMLTDMEARLSGLGLTSRVAVAPTWGAAWALARHGGERAICGAEEVAVRLAPLPASALRLDAATLLLLRRLGLKTVGALAEVPRLSLTRRFRREGLAGNPLLRLDQAMGRLAEPVASAEAHPRIVSELRLAEPIEDPTGVLPELFADLCARLARHRLGCRRLSLSVYRTDGEVSTVAAATAAPSADAVHLRRLFDDKLERIDPGFGFDLIVLCAVTVEPVAPLQTRLDGKADDDLHLPLLVDRLVARFGARSVGRPVPRASHLPERAEAMAGALAVPDTAAPPNRPPDRERPLRLLPSPEEVRVVYGVPEGPPAQFVWRRKTHRVARHAGPERIAPEWWTDRPGTRLRDYFRVEDQDGLRLWLYREGLHEDGRGGDPRWFVHGIFS